MKNLIEIFGNATAMAIKNNLSSAFISEIYDNAVDITVPTPEGDFIFGVYCYYSNGNDEKPLAGAIDFDSDTAYHEFSNDAFSDEEKAIIQNILNNHQFRKGQFSTDEEKS